MKGVWALFLDLLLLMSGSILVRWNAINMRIVINQTNLDAKRGKYASASLYIGVFLFYSKTISGFQLYDIAIYRLWLVFFNHFQDKICLVSLNANSGTKMWEIGRA